MNKQVEKDSKLLINSVDSIPHSVFVPYDPDVSKFDSTFFNFNKPYEYTGWRDESMAWKTSCALHGNLNPTPIIKIKGPDALKFLSDYCVNSFANFPIGTGKHGIMCNEEGLLMSDGVLLRLSEDEFLTFWLAPYIIYAFTKKIYNATLEDLTGKEFMFQITGPNSLKTLEAATGEDLKDIAFIHHRMSSINGSPVRILRLGMSGTLAYEVHGKVEDACSIYDTIFNAGLPFGIRKMGVFAYMMNHTEAGFPQAYYHFPYPWGEDEGFLNFLSKGEGPLKFQQTFNGSMGPDIRLRYMNPVDVGWGGMVKFDHEFVGREALEKIKENPKRKMVTLVWNVEDILDIYKSQFELGESYANMDDPIHFQWEAPHGTNVYYADMVLKNGKHIGISSGRQYSYFYRQMISLCSIDIEFSALGTEVIVLWGNPGTRQKEIRAVVSRFPYLDENRNQVVDVKKIEKLKIFT